LENLGTDRRITLKWNLKNIWWESVNWFHVAQDRDKWQALVNTMMNHERWVIP